MTYEDLTNQAILFIRKETTTLPMTIQDGLVVFSIKEADLTALLVAFVNENISNLK
jgi:ABC-type Co2+ transport system permease subunit